MYNDLRMMKAAITHEGDKLLFDESFGHRWLEVRRLEEAQEELVHQLQMGPSCLERRFVLFRVELSTRRVRGWRECSEQINAELQCNEHRLTTSHPLPQHHVNLAGTK